MAISLLDVSWAIDRNADVTAQRVSPRQAARSAKQHDLQKVRGRVPDRVAALSTTTAASKINARRL
jgi:hypothetical protein